MTPSCAAGSQLYSGMQALNSPYCNRIAADDPFTLDLPFGAGRAPAPSVPAHDMDQTKVAAASDYAVGGTVRGTVIAGGQIVPVH